MKIEEAISQPKFSSAIQKSNINLLYTTSWINSEMHHAFKPLGISSQQFNIMRILKGQNGRPASLKLITNRMIDKMSNTSRLIDKLVAKGYVKRETAACDRRQLEITLTDKGSTHLEKASRDVDKISQKLFSHMDEKKLNTLSDILDELREKEI